MNRLKCMQSRESDEDRVVPYFVLREERPESLANLLRALLILSGCAALVVEVLDGLDL